jgi:mannosyl-oligosaccharide glucosidase
VYGWDKHDGQNYGTQTIEDQALNIKLTTEFVKIGTNMKIRVKGHSINDEDALISMIYYLGFDSNEGKFTSKSQDQNLHTITLESPTKYTFISKDEISLLGLKTNVQQFKVDPENVWKLKETLIENFVENAKEKIKTLGRVDSALLFQIKSKEELQNSNVVAFQHFLKAPFVVEYTLTTEDTEFIDFKTAEEKFDVKFAKSFPLDKYNPDQIKFGKHLLSNMMGGIGYFHGDSIVDNAIVGQDEDDFDDEDEDEDDYFESEFIKRPAPDPRKTSATSLFTGVPSRSFFPRGFLWDTGFDLLLIQQFDVDIRYFILTSMDIIKSWTNLIDENGWVAREQILGPEARSKVPEEFQIQYPHYANPPTIVGSLQKHLELAEIVVEDKSHLKHLEFLESVYPKFKKNYEWFVNTQSGHTSDYNYGAKIRGFKWRGRKESHILTSGM